MSCGAARGARKTLPATRRRPMGCICYALETAGALSLGPGSAAFMSHNTFGHLFRVTTWGESHGPAIGCVVDGCPPGLPITPEAIQVVPRQAPAGAVAVRDAAAGTGRGRDPLGRLHGRRGPAGFDGRADLAADPQRRSALEGLWRHRAEVPAGPCRLHLSGKVRHPRLSRRRAILGARDGDAGGGRRHRATGVGLGHHRARRAGADGQDEDRSRPLGLGRGRQQSVLLSRPGRGERVGKLSRRHSQSGLVDRRHRRGRRRGRARRLGRAALRQTRPGYRVGDDVASTP